MYKVKQRGKRMHLLDKKQYQAILINSISDKERFKRLVENNTFKNYAGDPVGKVVKLRATLETFLGRLEWLLALQPFLLDHQRSF